VAGIRIEHKDGVARVILSRPVVRNALDAGTIAELTQAYSEFGADARTRVIVLTAEGNNFSAGADLSWMQSQAANNLDANVQDAERFADMLRAIYECPKPTIARVQGDAYAAGVGLIAANDIAIAAKSARFAITEAKLGLVPAVIGPYLVNAIGARAAKRLALTAELFGTDLAHNIGLIHEVVDEKSLDDTVERFVTLLHANAPAAMAKIKSLFREFRPGSITPEIRAFTAQAIAAVRATDEAREGLDAFFAKRKPQWPV
jgi:methylglutaconyl-CoA hydratase